MTLVPLPLEAPEDSMHAGRTRQRARPVARSSRSRRSSRDKASGPVQQSLFDWAQELTAEEVSLVGSSEPDLSDPPAPTSTLPVSAVDPDPAPTPSSGSSSSSVDTYNPVHSSELSDTSDSDKSRRPHSSGPSARSQHSARANNVAVDTGERSMFERTSEEAIEPCLGQHGRFPVAPSQTPILPATTAYTPAPMASALGSSSSSNRRKLRDSSTGSHQDAAPSGQILSATTCQRLLLLLRGLRDVADGGSVTE